jgi:phosphodiesterase/alkaline phosphatase D-like protein
MHQAHQAHGASDMAQGDGPLRGRELEIADILSFVKRAGIRNTIWLTADVHYTAAHYFDPGKAVFQDCERFWEFVSGPLHAGTFGPGRLDNSFGPQALYVKAPGKAGTSAERRPAVLRPCGDRRRDRGHDGHAQRPVVDCAGA